jgi:hypothetical protein
MLGYKVDSHWDLALAGDIQQLFTEVTRFRGGTLAIDTTDQHVDLEVGYSEDRWRLDGGLRGIHYLRYRRVPFVWMTTALPRRAPRVRRSRPADEVRRYIHIGRRALETDAFANVFLERVVPGTNARTAP